VTAPPTIEMNDAEAVKEFIAGLQNSLAGARRSGGLYSAFAHGKDGNVVRVKIQVPLGRE